MVEVLVYSAVFGGYDRVREPVEPGRYLLITDGRAPWGWIEQKESSTNQPRRLSRYHKTKGMPPTQYTLWLDGNIQLLVEPRYVIQEWLVDTKADIALFKHPGHDCIYREARQCKKKLKDSAETIDGQMDAYRRKGFPSRFGLGETCVVARRDTPAVREFNRLWWREIEKGSVRDQLSFDYVRWVMGTGIRVHFVDGGHRWKRREHKWFKDWGHNG